MIRKVTDLLDIVAIAQRAGTAILEVYHRDFSVVSKADDSPLTQADLASHKVILAALSEYQPALPVLSEESSASSYAERRNWRDFWLVDPLDGTKEFIKKNGEFTVNIALVRDHYPVAGVVHVPVTGVSYFGAAGLGCFRQDGRDQPLPIQARVPAATPPVVVGSRSHANPDLARRLARLGAHRMVSMGSSLKFCLVAEGLADFYPRLGPTSEWDTAAAQAVVEAAGGRVVTLDGTRLSCNRGDSLLNPEFLVFADDRVDWLNIMSASQASTT